MIHYTEEDIRDIIRLYKENELSDPYRVRMYAKESKISAYHCPLEDVPLYMSTFPVISKWRLAHCK